MNKYFNWSRFLQLLKFDFVLNKKKYLLFTLVIFIVLFLVSYYHLDDKYRLLKELNPNFDYKTKLMFYLDWFMWYYFIFVIMVSGSAFSFLRNKSECLSYLTLPASTLEKFCVEVLIRIIIFNIIYMVFYWLDFKLASYVFRMSFNNELFVTIPDFGLLDPITKPWIKVERIAVILSLLSLSALMLAGASYFKKYALFKSLLAFGCLLAVGYLVTLISYHILMPAKVNIFKIQIVDRELSNGYVNGLIAICIIGVFSSLFLLPFAYFNLKEKQV